MARTTEEIKQIMTSNFVQNSLVQSAYELDLNKTFEEQFSKVSLESIIFYVIAFVVFSLEKLFDQHLVNVDYKIRNQRPHTLGWYRTTALNFQFGGVLKDDITEYDNTGLSDDEIQAQQIITKCSVTKADTDKPTLIIKVAKATGKLSEAEKAAFTAYMEAIADAGVNCAIVSENADRLKLFITIRYDAMVMNDKGLRYIDDKRPAETATIEHLNNLEFNGTFYPSLLEQHLMREKGIRITTVRTAQASIMGQTPTDFVDKYEPFSGAIEIDLENDLHVLYEPF